MITGNSGKLLAAQDAFKPFGITVKQISNGYPEIQAKSCIEVAKYTALEAVKEFSAPVIREDHSLFIHALGGFPGPYTNYFDKTISAELLLKMLSGFQDRSAHMELAAALAVPGNEVFEFVYSVPLKISQNIKGSVRNWDRVLMLEDGDKTFAEGSESSRVGVWEKNYIGIAKKLLEL